MEWLQVIQTIGVPIAAMVALASYVLKRDKRDEEKDQQHAETVKALNAAHKEEMSSLQSAFSSKLDALTEVIQNNTVALTQLSERLGGIK